MSHLVIARKYRPQTFDDVVGQEHVVTTLKNSIKRDKVAHAYLLCGSRGTGKTSIARIFAKALNCSEATDGQICMKCSNCLDITASKSLAVREIDGASNNSVDDVRDLIDSFRSLPPAGSKYKIYIIDEVHMLSASAFNALLKSLEEPPPNTIFILATTEPDKIITTVLSRCQRFDLKTFTTDQIIASLSHILDAEGVKYSQSVLRMLARLAGGSLRDSQSLLERALAYSDKEIKLDDLSESLGVVSKTTLIKLSKAIINRDAQEAVKLINEVFTAGKDPHVFLQEFVTHWRELLLVKNLQADDYQDFGIDQDLSADLLRQTESLSSEDLNDLFVIIRQGADQALRSRYLRYTLEALVIKLASRVPIVELKELFSSAAGQFSQQQSLNAGLKKKI